jgi:hypothetical protein
MTLPGSGVVPPLVEPVKVKASEGIEPSTLSVAADGQPGEGQSTPLFSSQ